MPFARQGTELLDQFLKVRVTLDEKDQLVTEAHHLDLSLSELLRRRCLKVTHEDREFFNGLFRIQAELRRVGGLLKHVHVESGGSYSDQTRDALRTVNATVESIRSYMEALADDLQEN